MGPVAALDARATLVRRNAHGRAKATLAASGGGRLVRGPRHRNIICQTQTLAAQEPCDSRPGAMPQPGRPEGIPEPTSAVFLVEVEQPRERFHVALAACGLTDRDLQPRRRSHVPVRIMSMTSSVLTEARLARENTPFPICPRQTIRCRAAVRCPLGQDAPRLG